MLSENHGKLFKHFIEDAIEHKWLLALIIDDFTSIHSKRRPQGDKAFEAKSMCTIVVKAFKNIPAISVLQVSIMHDVNGISINTCLPTITSASCMQNISSSCAKYKGEPSVSYMAMMCHTLWLLQPQILNVYRKEDLNCVKVSFQQTISNPNNQLFHLLQFNTNHPSVTLSTPRVFATPLCKTNRFSNTFINTSARIYDSK